MHRPRRHRHPGVGPRGLRLSAVVVLLLATVTTPALASGDGPAEPDAEATREVVGLLLNFLGITVVVVILLLVLGLPARSWLRQRRDQRD